jgi:hypothetical protein
MLFIWATLFQESGLSRALTAGETYIDWQTTHCLQVAIHVVGQTDGHV